MPRRNVRALDNRQFSAVVVPTLHCLPMWEADYPPIIIGYLHHVLMEVEVSTGFVWVRWPNSRDPPHQ